MLLFIGYVCSQKRFDKTGVSTTDNEAKKLYTKLRASTSSLKQVKKKLKLL
jgi:hypothetical protein